MDMSALEELRQQIDQIDDKIIHLLRKRLEIMPQISAYKRHSQKAFYDKQREETLLSEKKAKARKLGIPEHLIHTLFSEVMLFSKIEQIKGFLNVSFLELEQQRYDNPDAFLAVRLELPADMETPISLYARFRNTKTGSFLFESIGEDEKFARYSFLGYRPRRTFTFHHDQTVAITQYDQNVMRVNINDPLQFLQEQRKHIYDADSSRFPLQNGMVGWLGYEYVSHFEPSVSFDTSQAELPLGMFLECDELIIFDHKKQSVILTGLLSPEMSLADAYQQQLEKFLHTLNIIQYPYPLEEISVSQEHEDGESNLDQEAFESLVEKCQQHIRDGDVFQIVPSRKFTMYKQKAAFDIYRHLRHENPSPYLYLLEFPDFSLTGASPETFVQVQGEDVHFCPLAGTYARSTDVKEDQKLTETLPHDPKERSEHMMLVDLGRNDLGKVCRAGSITVERLLHVKKYASVMHLATDITGKKRQDMEATDVLRAVFPRGTLTGAPKIRAMQLLAEYEPSLRGPYGGAVGYLDHRGNLDAAICIRSIEVHRDKLVTQAGAGVVMDSDPKKEFEETTNKAKSQLKCMK